MAVKLWWILLVFTYCCYLKAEDDETLVFTVASEANDGYLRYLRSAEEYGIKVSTLGFGKPWKGGNMKFRGGGYKINLLREALKPYKNDKNRIVIFSDSYDVIFLSPLEELIEKFKETKANVVFAAENFCWPDDELRSKYPKADGQQFLNSGMFIGYAHNIFNIITSTDVGDQDDDQLFYTHAYINDKLREANKIQLDHQAKMFQNLNGNIGDILVTINAQGETNLLNKKFSSNPSLVHGNGPSKIALNNYGNYLARAFAEGECQWCTKNNIDDEKKQVSFTVLVAIFIEQPVPFLEEFFDKILTMNYPKDKIHLFIHNKIEYHDKLITKFLEHAGNEKYISIKSITEKDGITEATARELAVNRCLTKKCDYLFTIDGDVHLENLDSLPELISYNQTFIAPMVKRIGGVWSNFWGALSDKGYYARSTDYMSIVNNEIRGIFNVPYISSCYLVKSKILNKLSYTKAEVDPDMALAEHLRNQEIFMYVANMNDYGHLINPDNFDIRRTRPEFYELFANQFDWEKRFIHPEYFSQLLKEIVPAQPCPDVFQFPIATDHFTDSLVEIMENFGKWSDGSSTDKRLQGGYEAVPTRDIHMNQVELEPLWLKFLQIYIRPLQEKVFLGYFHDPPRSLMNFVVRYRPDEQPSLRPHHDSSTYTINIALNRAEIDYEGGGCNFLRYNCSITKIPKGHVLMHPGRLTHFHEGLTVTKGTRYIMVSFIDPRDDFKNETIPIAVELVSETVNF